MPLDHSRNLLIQRLDASERQRLSGAFEELPLAFKQVLFEPGEPVEYLYFPETGVISVLTELEDGDAVETGTIGNDGFVGIPAVLGVRHSANRVLCQIPGRALRLPAGVIAAERDQAGAWFGVLLRYVNFVNAMASQVAACNRVHSVDARMSRWLLMTHDRVLEDDFPLTQQFLAQMLGVARPTVNIAGATLQRAGFITYTRGRIAILDRKGLESASCECYARIRRELDVALNGDLAERSVRGRRRIRR